MELIEAGKGIPKHDRFNAGFHAGGVHDAVPAMAALGRHVVEAVWAAVKSSRYRKNAPVWAAAVTAIMHPRLFACMQLHRESSATTIGGDIGGVGVGGGGKGCGDADIDGVGAIMWFTRSALKTGRNIHPHRPHTFNSRSFTV